MVVGSIAVVVGANVVEDAGTGVGLVEADGVSSVPTGSVQATVTTSTAKASMRRDIEGHLGMYWELTA